MPRNFSKSREAFLAAFDGMLAEYRVGTSAKALMARVGMRAASFYDELTRRGLSANAPRGKYQKRLIQYESSLAEEMAVLEAMYCMPAVARPKRLRPARLPRLERTESKRPTKKHVRGAIADGWDPAVLFKQPVLAQRVPVSLEGGFIEAPSPDRLKAGR